MTSFREWLTRIHDHQSQYDPIIVGDLLKAYDAADGADDRKVYDAAVANARADAAEQMRKYFERWEREWPQIRKESQDPLGRQVRRVYIMTERFVIYSADDPNCDEDVCSIRYALRDDYEACRALREKLNAFSPQVSYITDAVCSIRPIFGSEAVFRRFRERIFEMLALSMASALEDQPEKAQLIIDQTRTSVEDRRNSVVRMRYMTANTLSAALLLISGLVVLLNPHWFPQAPEFLSLGEGPGREPYSLPVLPVLLAGALGSFFSVALSLRSLDVSWSITPTEVFFSGFARVFIGVIAAGAVIWIVDGKWLLASVEDGAMPATVLLLGFIAGFSEMFVPNALKTIEDQAQVRQSGTATKTTVEVVQKPAGTAAEATAKDGAGGTGTPGGETAATPGAEGRRSNGAAKPGAGRRRRKEVGAKPAETPAEAG